MTTGTGAVLSLGGCLDGEQAEAPPPVALDEGQSCDLCGMVIQDHPGPAGQMFYPEPVEGRGDDEPAWFCSSVCTFDYYFEKKEVDREPVVSYVTDYSAVDYEVVEEGASLFVTAHLESESFVDADETWLVVDSEVKGAMGVSLVPFSDEGDAEELRGEHGGDVVPFDGVTRQLVDQL